MNGDGPIVGLQLESRPETLTIVRGMLGGLAEVLAIDPELLDDLKTSISEACNNVVLHAYGGGPGPMSVRLYSDEERLRVRVEDEGIGLPGSGWTPDDAQGIGVSVIRALTQHATFEGRAGGGTSVEMDFDARRDGRLLYMPPAGAAPEVTLAPVDHGDVALTLSPVALLAPVLGRLARTLAATAHFSLDRFSDVYLVTDTLAAHATAAAAGGRVGARLSSADRRLDLLVGPFRRGSSAGLEDRNSEHPSPLALLSDEVTVHECGDGEAVHVVVIDHRR